MKKYFTKADIVNQEALELDIKETYQRLLTNKRNKKARSEEQILEDTELGLVLEYYLMQEDPKFRKANQLNPEDYYHDLIDVISGDIHECKVTRSESGWDSYYVSKSIKRITEASWNKSKWMHLAIYDKSSCVYTYKGIKQIR